VEAASEHPLARAIVAEARARGLPIDPVTGFRSTAGGGVTAQLDGARIEIGSAEHLRRSGVEVPADPSGPETRVHVAVSGQHVGRIDLSDPPKAGRGQGRRRTACQGVRVAMLSGDGAGPVAAIADTLG
jgi:cation transport ATPase